MLYRYECGSWIAHQVGSYFAAKEALLPVGTRLKGTQRKLVAHEYPQRLQ